MEDERKMIPDFIKSLEDPNDEEGRAGVFADDEDMLIIVLPLYNADLFFTCEYGSARDRKEHWYCALQDISGMSTYQAVDPHDEPIHKSAEEAYRYYHSRLMDFSEALQRSLNQLPVPQEPAS